MLKALKFLVLSTALIFLLGYLLPGIRVSSPLVAMQVVVVLCLINLFLGNFLRLLTFPINRLSFGLIGFAINLLVIFLTARRIDGFDISGFLPLMFFAISLSIVSYVIDQKLL